MSHLQYYSYKGFGEEAKEKFWYNQAVRVGDRIEISGQGGWVPETSEIHKDLDAEVEQAFSNAQVYRLNIYVLGMSETSVGIVVKHVKRCMPDHQPLLTVIGAGPLALEGMRIEIEAVAHVDE
ncbi:putative translation initiation inhibitor [Coprinopsis marcescibilis]|uniref:Putative translation initiation inhibitor n=1 Tax=Coprinopsis marcescibilis TaxID=230819 RepID=A0A5C3KI60_COPMA|nr:putative translation initiation inhibitor [Coprinopsis marcescibilis]